MNPENIEKAAYLVLSETQNLENKQIKYTPSVIIEAHSQFCHVIMYALLSNFQKYIKAKSHKECCESQTRPIGIYYF